MLYLNLFLKKSIGRHFLLIIGFLYVPNFQAAYASELSDAKNIIKEWVNIKNTISSEKMAWQENKSMLNDIYASLNAEEKILRETITNAQQDTSRTDEERLNLISERDTYQQNSELLQNNISFYERQANLLTTQLPVFLQDELGPIISKLSRSDKSAYSLSERAQTLISFLTAVQQFDNTISVTNEIRTFKSGEQGEVKILYLGLSRAFFVNENKTTAGIGFPVANSPDGRWQWIEQPDLANDILKAINIYENRESPELISLPLQINSKMGN